MALFKSALGLTILFCAAHSLQASANSIRTPSSHCICDASDRFDPRDDAIIQFGPFKGQCQATCWKRSVRLVNQSSTDLIIANVGAAGHFWTLQVPSTARIEAIAQMVHMPVDIYKKVRFPVGHTQLRFHILSGSRFKLWPQVPSVKPMEMSDLVLSIEPNMPEKSIIDFRLALKWSYPINYQIVSLRDLAYELAVRRHRLVEQYRLRLSPPQVRMALEAAARMGSLYKELTPYHLLYRNCATEFFRVLAVAQHPEQKWIDHDWGALLKNYVEQKDVAGTMSEAGALLVGRWPQFTWKALLWRGLVDKKSRIADLNQEMRTADWAH